VNDRLAHNSLQRRCFEVEPVVGFEPTTDGLQNRRADRIHRQSGAHLSFTYHFFLPRPQNWIKTDRVIQPTTTANTKSKSRAWRTAEGIRIRPLKMSSGTIAYRAEIPESITGQRILKQFKTAEEAESYAAMMVVQRKNNGLRAFSLGEGHRADAHRALNLLAESKVDISLTELAEFYLKYARPAAGDITVTDLVAKYLDAKERQRLRPRSLADLHHRLGIFERTFGPRLVKELRTDEVETWLFADKSWSNQTRRNFRTVLHGFFGYALTQKYVAENPIAAVTNPVIDDREPQILTVRQASALLHSALSQPHLELLPYVALGLFCGIRTSELIKLDWEMVDLRARHVTIGSKIAKKRRIRVVTLPDSCRAWLIAGGVKLSGPICPQGFDRRWDKLLSVADRFESIDAKGRLHSSSKSLGILPWKSNALRHSAASYHFARHGDTSRTCAMLGQKDDQVLFDHYRSLVRPADARRFYAIKPPAQVRKIVSLCSAVAA
jgi:integrase